MGVVENKSQGDPKDKSKAEILCSERFNRGNPKDACIFVNYSNPSS